MKKISKKRFFIAAFAAVLCLSVSIPASLAYFSDYESASGGAVLKLGGQTITKVRYYLKSGAMRDYTTEIAVPERRGNAAAYAIRTGGQSERETYVPIPEIR